MFATPRSLLRTLVVIACTAPFAIAADVLSLANGDYALTVWATDDGLPHNSISGVVPRSDGFLWIGTQGGLVRFDGLEFQPVASALLDGVRSSGIGSVIAEDASTLLMASAQSGLVRWHDGEVTSHPLSRAATDAHAIHQLFRESDGVFWIVLDDHSVWRCAAGRVERFAAPATARTALPATFARAPDGAVFVARGNGIEAYDHGTLRRIPDSPAATVTIASARERGIWVGTGHRLAKFVDGRFEAVGSPWQSNSAPTAMFEDRSGTLWVAPAEQGLLRWKDGTTLSLATPHAKIAELTDDDEGNLWMATRGGGLLRLQPTRLSLVSNEPDWADTTSGAVCEDALGYVWFANRKGVRRLRDGHVDVLSGNSGWPKSALPLCPDAQGNVWFAVGPTLSRARAAAPETPQLVTADAGGTVHVLFCARDGSVWVGRNSPVLSQYRPDGSRAVFDAGSGFNAPHARSIGEDADGRIYVGTEDGRLVEIHGGRAAEPYAGRGLTGHAIRAIHGDAAGGLWLGTAGAGVLVRLGDAFAAIGTAQGLPDDVISQILEDDQGWLWFGSRRGIFKVRKPELLACAAGKAPLVTATTFGRADGLSGISAVGSYQPTAWKTRAGELWFVTRKGLVKTDPRRQAEALGPPPVYLEDIRADGRPVAATRRIRSDVRKLEFRFTAPTFVAADRVRFRYRLEGFDAGWVDGATQRFAAYPALPPGTYQFAVTASRGDLAWNPRPATFTFTVYPVWWQTWWARAVAMGAMLAALVAVVRGWSHRRLRLRLARLEQQRRLEQERVRIARNLHDDLGASLTHASMLADELAEDWRELPAPPTQAAQLAERVRQIARDLDAVVWTVSPKHDSLASLSAYIGDFAQEYFAHTPIACVTRVAENIPAVPLSPELRHHLFLIAKELFNNVLKHSGAHRVEVAMQYVAGAFELRVRDDGRGFSVERAEASGRNGLRNLRARAAETGGTLEIASSPQGTDVTLRFRTGSAEPDAPLAGRSGAHPAAAPDAGAPAAARAARHS